MRKLATIVLFAMSISLAGCAAELQKAKNTFEVITSAAVTPQQILVAANAFDAAEASATQYLIYCKSNKTQSGCALSIRQQVVKGVRAGRVARGELEPYITSGTAGPIAIYDTLTAAITSLQAATPKVTAQ